MGLPEKIGLLPLWCCSKDLYKRGRQTFLFVIFFLNKLSLVTESPREKSLRNMLNLVKGDYCMLNKMNIQSPNLKINKSGKG